MTAIDTDTPADADALVQTDLPLPDRRQGKVRDLYRLPAQPPDPARILIVATDRISAYDVVLPTAIPGKGCLLTEISLRWFAFIRELGLIEDHLLSADPADVPGLDAPQRDAIAGRMMLGQAAEVVPIECVVRGYLAGSGWTDYQRHQAVCGVALPSGLTQCDRLGEPIFTPATKAEVGQHDENIDFDAACQVAGRDVMERLRAVSIGIYTAAETYARDRGIILADTKFEFGYVLDAGGERTGQLILIDEVLTPDSSRFWPAEDYQPGRDQDSFDKQYVRNYLTELVKAGQWDKTAPGPELPAEVVRNTLARYREALERLFG